MKVTPRVYLIAESMLRTDDMQQWLESLGAGGFSGRSYGSHGERLTELAARRCYKSFEVGLNPNVTKIREDSSEYHRNILESGHGAVIEHASATFAFENVSRVFTHELVRHRAGCAYSQESLRYVRLSKGINYFMPPEIASNPLLLNRFESAMAELSALQAELADASGIDQLGFSDKKKLTSAFRRVAPIGLATGIVATFNLRALRHIIVLRTSRHAEYEIRLVFNLVAEIAIDRWPMLFQDFQRMDTGDGPDVGEWIARLGKV